MFVTAPSHRVREQLDIPLLSDCGPRELRRIAHLATFVTVEAGRVLCQRGDIGRECFLLLDGYVAVDANEHHYTVGRGAILGEIALLTPNGRRTATVTALTDASMLVFTRTEFSQLMAGVPNVTHKILREATRRLIENNEPS
jgi:CRP-like cAMP-binding protein